MTIFVPLVLKTFVKKTVQIPLDIFPENVLK